MDQQNSQHLETNEESQLDSSLELEQNPIKQKKIWFKNIIIKLIKRTVLISLLVIVIISTSIALSFLISTQSSFKYTKKELNPYYYKGWQHVYVYDGCIISLPSFGGSKCIGTSVKKIDEANRDTFKITDSQYYAKDKNFVYYKGDKIIGLDPITFENVKYKSSVYEKEHYGFMDEEPTLFSKDKNSVFFIDTLIEEADPVSFKIINPPFGGGCHYTKDRNNIYWIKSNTVILDKIQTKNFIKIEGVDVGSFAILSYDSKCFSKDRNNLYIDDKKIKIEDIDISTLEINSLFLKKQLEALK